MANSPNREGPAARLYPFSDPAEPGTPRKDIYGQLNTSDIRQMIREEVEQAVAPYRTEVVKLTNEIKELRKERKEEIKRPEVDKLKDDIVKLECYSRKNNLKFYGIRESTYETKFDCNRVILSILKDSNIVLHPKALESAHRLGPKQKHNPRPIIVQFFHWGEKDFVYSKAQHIWKTTGIRIEEDFAPKVESNRKILKPILIAATKCVDANGRHEFNASLRLDKLNVNGKVFTVNNMDKLPPKLALENLATQTKGNITAFFTKDSFLSNHHLANQQIGNKIYNCNEQFFMEQKALTFNDQETATAIMREPNPGRQKGLGRQIPNFNQKIWNSKCLDIMKTGLEAKFTQNPSLKQSLLATGTNMLLEANPKDSYWGIGMAMRDYRIWISNIWIKTATNHLGRLLSELRRELR